MISADQPTIFDPTKLHVWVTSRTDGNMKYEKGPDAAQNMAAFAAQNDFDTSQYVVMVVDDAETWDVIHEVTAADAGAGATDPATRIHADALVSTLPDLALLLPIADCCPVVLYDPEHHVVALVHLGWKSSELNLLAKVVAYLRQNHTTDTTKLQAYFGPCIKPESYIFADRPRQADAAGWQDFVYQQTDGWHIDIAGFNRQQLLDAGVLHQNIQVNPTDTGASDDYFSNYRANKHNTAQTEGRFAVVARLGTTHNT